MSWEKSPPELVDRFGAVLDRFDGVERRKMFGYPAAFLAGNMVTGLHQASWIVRLSPDDLGAATADGATAFEPMPGRPMKGFVALPRAVVEDDQQIAAWVGRAIEHARTLPPKK